MIPRVFFILARGGRHEGEGVIFHKWSSRDDYLMTQEAVMPLLFNSVFLTVTVHPDMSVQVFSLCIEYGFNKAVSKLKS